MYNSDPAMNMLKLIEVALGDYVDCGEYGLNSSVAKVVDRIKELETVLRSLTYVGDGYYVGWRDNHSFNKYGCFCIYCNAEWDRYTSTPPDSHTQDCPIAIARAALGDSEAQS